MEEEASKELALNLALVEKIEKVARFKKLDGLRLVLSMHRVLGTEKRKRASLNKYGELEIEYKYVARRASEKCSDFQN